MIQDGERYGRTAAADGNVSETDGAAEIQIASRLKDFCSSWCSHWISRFRRAPETVGRHVPQRRGTWIPRDHRQGVDGLLISTVGSGLQSAAHTAAKKAKAPAGTHFIAASRSSSETLAKLVAESLMA